MQVHELFDYHATQRPDDCCLIFNGEKLSYGTVGDMARTIAAGLAAEGVQAGHRVAILCQNCPEYLAFLMACSQLGAVAVPLNYRLAPAEIAYVLADAQVHLLLNPDTELEPLLLSLLDSDDEAPRCIAHTERAALSWDEWLSNASGKSFTAVDQGPEAFLQLYTSGTTGHPKGVVLSHANLVSLFTISTVSAPHKAGADTVDLVSAPNFHIGGSGTLLLPIMAGGSVVLHKTFDPFALVNDVEQYKVDHMFIVPAMILAVISMVPDLDKRDFSHLKQIMYGASPITSDLLEQALKIFQCDFAQVYGMTETTGSIVMLTPADHHRALKDKPELLQSCGRPQAGVAVKICDPDGKELPAGETGELWIRSGSNMLEYYNNEGATAETLINGWIRTGDSGVKDEEGFLYLRDRIKDMIVSGGENIYPIEIENVLSRHPAIADVAVVGIPNEKYGEAPLACVALKPEQSLSEDEMIDYCRDKLAGYKIPRQLQIMEALPRNPSGKILKKELRAPHWKGKERNI